MDAPISVKAQLLFSSNEGKKIMSGMGDISAFTVTRENNDSIRFATPDEMDANYLEEGNISADIKDLQNRLSNLLK